MHDPAHAHLWHRLTAELQPRLSAAHYDVWITPLELRAVDGDTLTVAAPTELVSGLRERFSPLLAAAARAVLGPEAGVVIAERGSAATAATSAAPAASAPADDSLDPFELERAHALHPKYTFEQFVIGRANSFAHAAALAAAEQPGAAFNPLLFVGPPGTGKTHLLHSIGNYVTAFGGGLTVRYATAEDFANGFRASLRRRKIDVFKRRYRTADVLLLDDVQFLASKTHTEEEFFHTFNALVESGSQIVMTADCLPREMSGLAERLRQRFDAGLVLEIDPPDPATRRALIRKRAQLDGIDLPDDVVALICDRLSGSVRDLESALIRVSAYASLQGGAIDTALARTVLDRLYARERARAPLSIDRIQEAVASAYSLEPGELQSSSRAARISRPRQLAMLLAREHTAASLPAIGAAFGGRDHTTVLHACRRARQRLDDEATFAEEAARIRALLDLSAQD